MKTRTLSDIQAWARKYYSSKRRDWLAGAKDAFPCSVVLLELTEKEFMSHPAQVRDFHNEWNAWAGAGHLESATFSWPRLGEHTLPSRLHVTSSDEVAKLAGVEDSWRCITLRIQELATLSGVPVARFACMADVLEHAVDVDWRKLCACLQYFIRNPDCKLFIRQLPIEGVDTKWVGLHMAELTRLLSLAYDQEGDFYTLTGVRLPEHLNHVVVRVLCPELRKQVAGARHLDMPVADVAAWSLRPEKVLFVENLESGIALEDIPGAIAFVGKGNAATTVAKIDWVARTKTYYWGDLDTYGLAIFSRVRALLPDLTPIMMDLETLLANQALWVPEVKQHPAVDNLPEAQQEVFRLLVTAGKAKNMRLEQERISWPNAWREIQHHMG